MGAGSMTWYFDASGGRDMDVYDHQGTLVTTVQPDDSDASGWAWPGEFPKEVLDVMHAEASDALDPTVGGGANIERAVAILLDMAGEQVEAGDGSAAGQ